MGLEPVNRLTKLAHTYVNAYPRSIVSYHGTDAKFLPSILQVGLRAQKPPGGSDFGVYLTNDMEKAARYAVEGTWSETNHPCILEVVLTGRNRVKKVYRDTLDREEDNLYGDYGYDSDDDDLSSL